MTSNQVGILVRNDMRFLCVASTLKPQTCVVSCQNYHLNSYPGTKCQRYEYCPPARPPALRVPRSRGSEGSQQDRAACMRSRCALSAARARRRSRQRARSAARAAVQPCQPAAAVPARRGLLLLRRGALKRAACATRAAAHLCRPPPPRARPGRGWLEALALRQTRARGRLLSAMAPGRKAAPRLSLVPVCCGTAPRSR